MKLMDKIVPIIPVSRGARFLKIPGVLFFLQE
jgi:hypothetical protein